MTMNQKDMGAVDREVGAAMLAAGIGSVVLGIMIVLAEASAKINSALVWVKPVGALSGKTTVEIIAFVLSWAVLHYAFRGRAIRLNTVFVTSVVLIGLGFLLTYPPFFELIADSLKPMFGG